MCISRFTSEKNPRNKLTISVSWYGLRISLKAEPSRNLMRMFQDNEAGKDNPRSLLIITVKVGCTPIPHSNIQLFLLWHSAVRSVTLQFPSCYILMPPFIHCNFSSLFISDLRLKISPGKPIPHLGSNMYKPLSFYFYKLIPWWLLQRILYGVQIRSCQTLGTRD